MKIEIHMLEAVVAREAAHAIAAEAHRAVAERGRFVVAFSDGRTPWPMLRALAAHPGTSGGQDMTAVDLDSLSMRNRAPRT